MDLEESQVRLAQKGAADENIGNASFQVGSVYDIPFPDESFDAVLVHAVLEHLERPLDGLKEAHRVLKSGGVIGARSPDQGGWFYGPENPLMNRFLDLSERLYRHNGGDRRVGRRLRGLLHQVGYRDIEASASYRSHGTEQDLAEASESFATLLTSSSVSEQFLKLGWCTEDELRQMAKVCENWGKLPDAFMARAWVEAVGRK